MKRLFSALFVFCIFVVPARADYLSGRATAMELFNAGKFQEAADGFLRLEEGAKNDVQQADALTNAALALQRMKRPDEAMAVAEKIRSAPLATSCRISLLRDSRQWEALLKLTKDEDFSVWPEKVIYPAYMARAQAQAILGHAAEAESDALRAEESTISPNQKAMAWSFIAERARTTNEPPQKALDAYAKIIAIDSTSGGILQRALYNRALLLTDLTQWDQARADISQLENLQKDEPHWNCVTQLALGYLAEKQGQTAEALASYREAAAIPKAPEELVNEARAKIAALEAAPKGETPEVKN